MNIPDTPNSRLEQFLAAIASGDPSDLPEPITREEAYLAFIAENGGGGGTGEVTGVKGSAESTFRKGNVSISPANIGLGNVNNTSDSSKPVSTPQQAALDLKVDKVDGKGLSTEDYTTEEKTKLEGLENYDDTSLSGRVGDIEAVIPSGASTSDKLAKSSDIPDVSGFITNTVNNLVNYYLKSETYTQAEVDALISAIITLNIEVVQTLPTTDISRTTIYLVPNADPQTSNVKDEYINLDGTTAGWELIGSTAIDLTGYVTDAELTTALADYTTTADLTTLFAAKQDKNLSSAISVDGTPQSTVEGALSAINTLAGANKTAIGNIKDGQSIDSFGDVETALADKADDTSVYKTFSFGNTGSGGSTVKYIELTGAYSNDVAKENSYMITGKNGESAILVLSTGTEIGVYSDPRLLYLTRGTSTPIVSANLDSTNGKVYVGIGKYTYVHISQIGGERTNWSGKIITELPSGATTVAIVSDVAAKADKVASATNGNFAGLDANGNLTDSGKKASDFVTPSEMGRQLPLVNLGTEYTAELKADISSGKFEKAVVGGYLTINGHVYYLAHPDYWLHTGDTECTTHHMLVIPAEGIGTGKMNDTKITTGGYTGSDFKTGNNSNTALATARAQITADFGAANILTHRERFINAVTDGKASGWAWADSDVDLMNEVMVYGCNVWASYPGYETGIDKCQLKLFRERPDLITTRSYWWLRSVTSATNFARVSINGDANSDGADATLGVRPVFAIC